MLFFACDVAMSAIKRRCLVNPTPSISALRRLKVGMPQSQVANADARGRGVYLAINFTPFHAFRLSEECENLEAIGNHQLRTCEASVNGAKTLTLPPACLLGRSKSFA